MRTLWPETQPQTAIFSLVMDLHTIPNSVEVIKRPEDLRRLSQCHHRRKQNKVPKPGKRISVSPLESDFREGAFRQKATFNIVPFLLVWIRCKQSDTS